MPPKIAFIGAGSVRFTLDLINDIAGKQYLSDSSIDLMDVDEKRLDVIYELANRLSGELGDSLKIQKTTSREAALKDADYVINTALAKAEDQEDGYEQYEKMRELAERHGYYRGIDAQNFNRVSDYFAFTNYNQLKLSLDIAESVESVCPDAWMLNTANPVFEITQLVRRETDVKILGICHGFHGAHNLFDTLGLDTAKVDWQLAGVNHGIWLTRFRYGGENAYPILDNWIKDNASGWEPDNPWDYELSPAALDMYDFYGKMPINDTVRNNTWKYHYDIAAKKRWYGKFGGIDNDVTRPRFYKKLRKKRQELFELAGQEGKSVVEHLDLDQEEQSVEQHIPIINSLEGGKETRAFPNIPNGDVIDDLPEDIVVEVPVKVDRKGIHPEKIEPGIPERINKMYLRPRVLKMEWALEAFTTGDKRVLEEVLVRDPRTSSFEQVKKVWKDIMELPFNKDMKEYYEG